jgi:hypothetical protein
MTMTPEHMRWVRVYRQTFEEALRATEQEHQEMMEMALGLSAGPMRETWEKKLVIMAERLRRQREAWDRAVAEEGDRL